MGISEELEKLTKLKADGAISEEEFSKAKARLLDSPGQESNAGPGQQEPPRSQPAPVGLASGDKPALNVNQWAMFLHLSQLANCIIPLAGIVAPIVLWQMKKDESPEIDRHGKMVVNWLISALIYGCICFALVFVFVGIPLLILLGLAGLIFAIVGGIKANNGEFWEYPLTIKFLQ